jgi:hypothetical protein
MPGVIEMNPDIENALSEVACNTGKHLYVVERVFDLMMAVHEYGHSFEMRNDTLTDVTMLENLGPLPSSLCDEIEESYDDVADLFGSIMRALHRMN